jgi:hypothetical protein
MNLFVSGPISVKSIMNTYVNKTKQKPLKFGMSV